MVKRFTSPEPRSEHIPTPIKLGSIIPDVISSLSNPATDRNKLNHPASVTPTITIITDTNRSEVNKLVESNKLMVVHCSYKGAEEDDDYKISKSPTTYLWDEVLEIRSKLVYADGIAIEPEDQVIPLMDTAHFTLYFKPFPAICKKFWLWEETTEPYAFAGIDILRNDKDEYWVELVYAPF